MKTTSSSTDPEPADGPIPSGDDDGPSPAGGTPPPAQQPWQLSFALFACGFLLMVTARKLKVSAPAETALKIAGAVACAFGFYLSRQMRPPKR